jgi:O-antigen/teichoic acid export membrane protein
MSLARTSLIIFIMRFSNMGLMMVGPILLARLLPVYDFGLYREFLVYSGALMTITAFALSNGLMYLVPANPGAMWALVRQTILLTAASTFSICLAVGAADLLTPGDLLGKYSGAVLVYVLLYVNLDFWEHLWLAQKKPSLAFYYTSGRLALRLSTVAIAAILTRDIEMIIHALLVLEAVRLIASAIVWRTLRRRDPPSDARPGLWSAQLRYCLPLGISLMVTTLNSYVGSILISATLGAVLLAQYAVGTYAVPVLYMLRNSVSDALLPHMAGQENDAEGKPRLQLWYQSNTLFAVMLLPVGVLLARFAELIVVTLFSAKYLPAVIVFQVYLLSILTHLVDFGVPFRLLGRTSIYLYSTLAAMITNVALLFVLLPHFGILAAIFSTLGGEVVMMTIHTIMLSRATGDRPASLLCVKDTWRVMVCCLLPLPLLAFPIGSGPIYIPAAVGMALAYIAAFLALLWRFGTPATRTLLEAGRDRVIRRPAAA